MNTAGLRYPLASVTLSILLTVPDTDENTAADTNPPASAIFVPTLTLSPRFTIATAGAPMCCDSGNTA